MNKDFFVPLKNRSPYFKVAFQGTAGTGKSHTAALVAIGLHGYIKSDKPIVFVDTEQSGKFLMPMFRDAGIEVLLKESRTLPDLVTAMKFCHEGNADVMIIDSITHIYEKFIDDYKQKKNKQSLSMYDFGIVKPMWRREFVKWFVNSHAHILFTGREGYTYDQQDNGGGSKEFVKSGVKMAGVEKETGHEPDLLVRMVRVEELLDADRSKRNVYREAMPIKDKSGLIDGKAFKNPTFEDFRPFIDFLLKDPQPQIEKRETHPNADLIEDETDHRASDKDRTIELERKDAMLNKVAAGTTGDAKKLKMALTERAFYGETSDTAIACMTLEQLLEGNGRLALTCRAVYDVQGLEPMVYPVAKAIVAARMKYLKTTNLGESTVEQLQEYSKHMEAKDIESQKKEGKE